MKRAILAAAFAATLALAAPSVATANDSGRIASQYSSWAGSQSNAESLVAGLRNGSPVTLVTTSNGTKSIAGFTPASSMSAVNVNSALSNAQRSLSRMGISNPTAEQMQAALIGGEVQAADGKVQELRGTVAVRGGNPQLASR